MTFAPLSGSALAAPVALLLVEVVALILNGLFLATLYFKRRLDLQYTRGDLFVGNIAFVDFLACLRVSYQWAFLTGDVGETMCAVDALYPRLFVGTACCLYCALAIERYLGVVKLIRLEQKWMIVAVVSCYVFGFLFDGVMSTLLTPYGLNAAKSGCNPIYTNAPGLQLLFGFQVTGVWLTFLVVYYRVYKVSTASMSVAGSNSRDSERALALRLFMIVLLFTLCWSPAMCGWFYVGITGHSMPAWLNGFTGVMVAINTIVDPGLFLWVTPDNRRAMYALLTCAIPLKMSTKRAIELSTTVPPSRSSRNTRAGGEGREQSRSGSVHMIGASPAASPASSPPSSPIPTIAAPIAPLPDLALPGTSASFDLAASETQAEHGVHSFELQGSESAMSCPEPSKVAVVVE
jgi:hypothetical protein